eukprot:Pgem_evm1s14977
MVFNFNTLFVFACIFFGLINAQPTEILERRGVTCCGEITIQSGDTCSGLLAPCGGVTKYINCGGGHGCGTGLSGLFSGDTCTMHC